MNTPYVFKKCSHCHQWLVASTFNFNKLKKGKYGLQPRCRKCHSKSNKKYNEQNKEKIAEYNKKYLEKHREERIEYYKKYRKENIEERKNYDKRYKKEHREEIAEYNKKYKKENREKIAEYNKEYNQQNKEKIAEYGKKYREEHKEELVEKEKIYREEHKEFYTEYNKKYYVEYYAENKEKIVEHQKQYYKTPQGQATRLNARIKRRQKQEQQGKGLTGQQWLEMMNFFDWKCAYSGEYIGGKKNQSIRSIDHIVPLAKGGAHEIWNCVPMNRSLNSSKNDKDIKEWYPQQDFYDEDKLSKINEWRKYSYNKWGKNVK